MDFTDLISSEENTKGSPDIGWRNEPGHYMDDMSESSKHSPGTSGVSSSSSHLLDEDTKHRQDDKETNAKEEVFRVKQFVINDMTRIPPVASAPVTNENDSVCDALRELGILIEMTDFETDPLEFWFLTRLLDVLRDAETKGHSERLQKTTISWLGFVLHRVVNTNSSRAELFEEIKYLLLESVRVLVKSCSMPTPMQVLEQTKESRMEISSTGSNNEKSKDSLKQNEKQTSATQDGPKRKGGEPTKNPSIVTDQKLTAEVMQKELEFLTSWIYQTFAESSTFDSIRLLMPLRKKILTNARRL